LRRTLKEEETVAKGLILMTISELFQAKSLKMRETGPSLSRENTSHNLSKKVTPRVGKANIR
jgi:hypothetical protein